MISPVDCLMLPGQRLAILDAKIGILLFNLAEKRVIISTNATQSNITKWRYPKCLTYIPETDHLLVNIYILIKKFLIKPIINFFLLLIFYQYKKTLNFNLGIS